MQSFMQSFIQSCNHSFSHSLNHSFNLTTIHSIINSFRAFVQHLSKIITHWRSHHWRSQPNLGGKDVVLCDFVFIQIFAVGMLRELNITQEMVDRIFPRLDDLLDIHVTFLLSLIGTQKRSADKSIEEIGDVLLQQVALLFVK